MTEVEFKPYIKKDVAEITPQKRTLDNIKKEQKVNEQLELLKDTIHNIDFNQKPDFVPFKHENYIFDVVSDPYELIEAFKLRLLAYSHPDVGFMNPELFPLGLEFDEFDKVSTHFYARNLENNKMCCYIRLIRDTDLGLHMKIDVSDYREKYKIAEVSRSLLYPRDQPKYVYKNVLNNLKLFAKQKGIEKIVGESPINLMKLFTRLDGPPMSPYPLESNPKKNPYRTWHVREKTGWDCKKDITLYGNIIHLDHMKMNDLRR